MSTLYISNRAGACCELRGLQLKPETYAVQPRIPETSHDYIHIVDNSYASAGSQIDVPYRT